MKLKVLLIEDDPDVSETIVTIIKSFSETAEIEQVKDGDGFRKGGWRAGGWDLVILDLMMPGVTGFEVCEQLRHYPATRSVPIFALTGYDTLQNEERIKAAGASSYMSKPFEVSQFMSEVKKLVPVLRGRHGV